MMGKAGHGCMRCGSDDVEVRRPGWAEGLRDWLRFGGRWRPSSQVCRRCGHVRVAGSAWYLARRRGWWSVAVGLVRLLRQRRTMVPAPAIWSAAKADARSETLLIVSGIVTVHLGDQTYEAGPGALVWMPRKVPHHFENNGEQPAELLAVVAAGLRRG